MPKKPTGPLTSEEFSHVAHQIEEVVYQIVERIYDVHGQVYADRPEAADEGAPFISGTLYAAIRFAMGSEDEDDTALRNQLVLLIDDMIPKARMERHAEKAGAVGSGTA